MSDWRPSSTVKTAQRRAALLERARAYFAGNDILAVDTPALSPYAGSDPNIDCFGLRTCTGKRRYLHTSPEFHMKRLLAAGYPDIYSICRVFRDGEAGSCHLQEFTLIEWYRRGFGLAAIVADTTRLIAHCLERPDLHDRAVTIDYADAMRSFAGIDVYRTSVDEMAGRAGADADLRAILGGDRAAWLDLLLDMKVEPQFDPEVLTVLQHFPASKAALARLCPDDERCADRFEVFIGSTEVANGYVELTDAAEQTARIAAEIKRRKETGKRVDPRDRHLIAALQSGLPACAGVAVGVERMHMVLDNAEDIADVVTFAYEAPDG